MIASIGSLLKGAACGATGMYFFDPDRGRRRRALLRDRAVALVHECQNIWRKGSRDLANRTLGIAAETRRALDLGPVDDATLSERVRATLGHHIDHARRVDVEASDGIVTLRGAIRPGEPERVVRIVERVPGVRGVESALVTAGEPVGQIACPRTMRPGTRLILTAGGGTLLLGGMLRRGFLPTLLGSLGAGFLAQGLASGPGRKRGLSGVKGVRCQAAVTIAAPIEKVYEFICDLQQSGRFLPRSLEWESLGHGKLRWQSAGDSGADAIVCEEVLLDAVENSRIVWASTDSSPVRYLGEARFDPDGQDGTRLSVDIIHAAAENADAAGRSLGGNPQAQLNQTLARIRGELEAGTVPESAAGATSRKQQG